MCQPIFNQSKSFAIIVLLSLATLMSPVRSTAKLSDGAEVVLFTCEPGHELYAGFGHSALWINDAALGIDRLYNYGTFDFNTPNFYLKFMRGRLDYQLSVTSINRFLAEYNHRGIGVYGQALNLTLEEKQRMFEFLENNALPENRNYRYDFFLDNCATRIRDVLISTVDGEVTFGMADQNTTFRELLFPYLQQSPWTKLGINLILGLPADRKALPYDYMYLPDYLRSGFEHATISVNGEIRPLVASGREYLPMQLTFSRNALYDPVVVFLSIILVVMLLSVIEIRKKKYFVFLDFFLMYLSVAAGLFLFLMWVATDHLSLNHNLNCFWLVPAQLFFIVILHRRNRVSTPKHTLVPIFYTFVIAVLQLLWPQNTEPSFMILNLLFMLRYLLFYKRQAFMLNEAGRGDQSARSV